MAPEHANSERHLMQSWNDEYSTARYAGGTGTVLDAEAQLEPVSLPVTPVRPSALIAESDGVRIGLLPLACCAISACTFGSNRAPA